MSKKHLMYTLWFTTAAMVTTTGWAQTNKQWAPSPLQGLMPGPIARSVEGTRALEKQVVDLNEVIADFAKANDISLDEAMNEGLRYLGLSPSESQPQVGEIQCRKLSAGIFEVTAPAAFHEMLPLAMESLRCGKKQIVVETRFVEVSAPELAKLTQQLPLAWTTHITGTLPPSSTVMEERASLDADANMAGQPIRFASARSSSAASTVTVSRATPTKMAVLNTNEKDRLVNSKAVKAAGRKLLAPKVTLFPTQTATLSDAGLRPFVVGVSPVEGDHNTAHQPVIQAIEDGTIVKLTGTIHNDGVRLSSDIILSRVNDVEAFTFQPAGTSEEATIQLPEHQVRTVRLTNTLRNGDTLVVDPEFVSEETTRSFLGSKQTKQHRLLIVISVNVVDG